MIRECGPILAHLAEDDAWRAIRSRPQEWQLVGDPRAGVAAVGVHQHRCEDIALDSLGEEPLDPSRELLGVAGEGCAHIRIIADAQAAREGWA